MSSFFQSLVVSILAGLLTTAAASVVHIHGTLATSTVLPDLSLIATSKVLLNGGQQVAYLQRDGSFTFSDVSDGVHLLEVIAPGYIFDKARVTVAGQAVTACIHIDGTNWIQPGPPLEYPLNLPAKFKIDPFTPKEGFNIMSIFANPMMLMMGGSLLMVFLMPKLMSGIDPEALKEAQQKQSDVPKLEMPDISQGLANWLQPQQPQSKQSSPRKK